MKTLNITSHFKDPNEIKISVLEKTVPQINENECLIKVASSAVNPSDALAIMGYFKQASLPRIPGRDFAGTVVQGPSHLIGKKMWGTGGTVGIDTDGTQAEYFKLNILDLAEIPNNLDLITAGAQTLPYVTAYYALVSRACIQKNESVLVVGALGQVGKAAMSILQWQGCQAIALVRGQEELARANQLGWNAINSEEHDLYEKILKANHGAPLSVILNSVGNAYWTIFLKLLAEYGRIVTISAREESREALINLFDLYRANQTLIGINTVSLNFSENAKLLNALKSGFETQQLTPLTIDPQAIYSPENAVEAYQAVLKGSNKRIVITF